MNTRFGPETFRKSMEMRKLWYNIVTLIRSACVCLSVSHLFVEFIWLPIYPVKLWVEVRSLCFEPNEVSKLFLHCSNGAVTNISTKVARWVYPNKGWSWYRMNLASRKCYPYQLEHLPSPPKSFRIHWPLGWSFQKVFQVCSRESDWKSALFSRTLSGVTREYFRLSHCFPFRKN